VQKQTYANLIKQQQQQMVSKISQNWK